MYLLARLMKAQTFLMVAESCISCMFFLKKSTVSLASTLSDLSTSLSPSGASRTPSWNLIVMLSVRCSRLPRSFARSLLMRWIRASREKLPSWPRLISTSVKECGLYEALSNGEYQFYDRDKVSTQEEKQEIALKAFTSDYFLGSVNAMSEDGVFINIDGNANRVAAYAYGPKHVLLIVGMNKVVKTEADAMSRARNEAAPINAQRFGIDTPCSKNGTCFDCKSPQCICCQILTTRFSRVKGRFQIILVDENLGF